MLFQRVLVMAAVLCASAALAAETPELRPLKGDKFKGELVGLSDKQIVLKVDGKDRVTPTEQTLQLEFAAVSPPRDVKYAEVELVDRSLLRCADVAFKGKEATLSLLSGQTVKVPLTAIGSVMKEAQDLKLVTDWKGLFAGKKRSYDAVVVKSEAGKLSTVEGTFGDATDDGKMIGFTPRGGDKRELRLERIHGLLFLRPPDPNQPSLLCKFFDKQGSSVMARGVALEGDKVVATAQCGVRVAYDPAEVAKLDYSKGKLTYLSDVELARVKVTDNSEFTGVLHFRRDKNLDGEGPIRVAGKTYPKGLALHAHCELTFDLEGEFREFKFVAGVDDRVGQASDGPTTLRVEADGKELLSLQVTRKDGGVEKTLNVIDVQKLKIVVTSDDVLGLGRHLDLADAKVSK